MVPGSETGNMKHPNSNGLKAAHIGHAELSE